jgi:hypothetical protein
VELLPSFEVLDEYPLTGGDNYLIVWGHQSAPKTPNNGE